CQQIPEVDVSQNWVVTSSREFSLSQFVQSGLGVFFVRNQVPIDVSAHLDTLNQLRSELATSLNRLSRSGACTSRSGSPTTSMLDRGITDASHRDNPATSELPYRRPSAQYRSQYFKQVSRNSRSSDSDVKTARATVPAKHKGPHSVPSAS